MPLPTKRPTTTRSLLAGGLLVIALAACGNNATTAPECTDSPKNADLGDGLLCVDTGFRFSADDFGFANWAGLDSATEELRIDTLVKMYGADDVCAEGVAEPCRPLPNAALTLEQWEASLMGGRCEGLAALAMRFFLGIDSVSATEQGVETTFDLEKEDVRLEDEINYWWATQYAHEVQEATEKSRRRTPSQIAEDLIEGLVAKEGHTIGIYGDGYGHAVTPYAVTKIDDTFRLHVYDNNFPKETKFIEVDTTTDTWRYDWAGVNPDGSFATWSGGKGTIELTPMSARKGPFTSPFHASQNGTKGHSVVTLSAATSGGPAASLLITTASGKVVGVHDGEHKNEVDGAKFVVGKGGLGMSMVHVFMPAGEEYGVHVVSATGETHKDKVRVRVAIHANNGTHKHIESDHSLTGKDPEKPHANSKLRVTDDHDVHFTHDEHATVSVANQHGAHTFNVEAGHRLQASHAHSGSSISVIDENGTETRSHDLKQPTVAG